MKLPPLKKPGDPVLASDWNMMLDAISARTPCPGVGLKLSASSGGFSYSMPPPMIHQKGQPPFSVIAIQKEGSSYKVTMMEGWVIERHPKTAGHPHVEFHMPKAGGIPLDRIPRPRLTMREDDIAWCRYHTDNKGQLLSAAPEIVIDSNLHDGTHYYPPDPEGSGGEGDYYVKLFKLILVDDVPFIVEYQQSDIEHWAQLWYGENVGTGAKVYKEHDEDENTYKFRQIDGRDYYSGDSADPGVTEQIKVVTDVDTVRVIGNGKKGILIWRDCDGNEVMRLEWNDGLITSSGPDEMEAGCDGYSSNYYNI